MRTSWNSILWLVLLSTDVLGAPAEQRNEGVDDVDVKYAADAEFAWFKRDAETVEDVDVRYAADNEFAWFKRDDASS